MIQQPPYMTMTAQEIELRVKQIIAELFGMDVSNIKKFSHIEDDFQADSMDILTLVMEIEDEFGISIPDEDADKIKTVGDFINYITQSRTAETAVLTSREKEIADQVRQIIVEQIGLNETADQLPDDYEILALPGYFIIQTLAQIFEIEMVNEETRKLSTAQDYILYVTRCVAQQAPEKNIKKFFASKTGRPVESISLTDNVAELYGKKNDIPTLRKSIIKKMNRSGHLKLENKIPLDAGAYFEPVTVQDYLNLAYYPERLPYTEAQVWNRVTDSIDRTSGYKTKWEVPVFRYTAFMRLSVTDRHLGSLHASWTQGFNLRLTPLGCNHSPLECATEIAATLLHQGRLRKELQR